MIYYAKDFTWHYVNPLERLELYPWKSPYAGLWTTNTNLAFELPDYMKKAFPNHTVSARGAWVEEGILYIQENWAWDGASGGVIDTTGVLLASLIHDALWSILWAMEKANQKVSSGAYRKSNRLYSDTQWIQSRRAKNQRGWWKYNSVAWIRSSAHRVFLNVFGWIARPIMRRGRTPQTNPAEIILE